MWTKLIWCWNYFCCLQLMKFWAIRLSASSMISSANRHSTMEVRSNMEAISTSTISSETLTVLSTPIIKDVNPRTLSASTVMAARIVLATYSTTMMTTLWMATCSVLVWILVDLAMGSEISKTLAVMFDRAAVDRVLIHIQVRLLLNFVVVSNLGTLYNRLVSPAVQPLSPAVQPLSPAV